MRLGRPTPQGRVHLSLSLLGSAGHRNPDKGVPAHKLLSLSVQKSAGLLPLIPWRDGGLSHLVMGLLEGPLQRNKEMVFANCCLVIAFLKTAPFRAPFGKRGSKYVFYFIHERTSKVTFLLPGTF